MASIWVIMHTVATELVVGALVFAALCIFFHPVASWMKGRTKPDGIIQKWAHFTEGVTDQGGYAAAIFGTFALVLAAATGSFAWPADQLAANAIIHNKIFFSAVALVTWIWVIVLRWRIGPGVWEDRKTLAAYEGLAMFGLVNIAMTGAVGGHVTGKGSALDALLKDFNFNSDATFALPIELAIFLAGLGVAMIGYAFWSWRAARAEAGGGQERG